MSLVKCGIAVSVDGFVAGPNQSLENPFGERVDGQLHRWMFEEGEAHAEELAELNSGGAYVMGRNMFGPGRDSWDESWNGWWGPNPPYQAPVFVLTHHERKPVTMEGGTVFNFVTDGIESALAQAKAAAGDQNVSIMGGAATINQYLAAGHIDELFLHVAPVILGAGERLFDGVEGLKLEPLSTRTTKLVTHVKYRVLN